MDCKDELREIYNKYCTCYYFDGIMRVKDIDFSDILLDNKFYKEKYKTILTYEISYKNLTGVKPLRIRFDKIDRFIKIHDGIRHSVLFDRSWYGEIFYRNEYLIREKSGIAGSINHNFARIRTDSYNSLSNEKILTVHNVIILITSGITKYKNHYYYNIFLEKGS